MELSWFYTYITSLLFTNPRADLHSVRRKILSDKLREDEASESSIYYLNSSSEIGGYCLVGTPGGKFRHQYERAFYSTVPKNRPGLNIME